MWGKMLSYVNVFLAHAISWRYRVVYIYMNVIDDHRYKLWVPHLSVLFIYTYIYLFVVFCYIYGLCQFSSIFVL